MSEFLDAIGASIGPAVDFLASDAILTQAGQPAADGQGGWIAGAGVETPVRVIVTDYADSLMALGGGQIGVKDRRAIVLAHSLPSDARLAIGCSLLIDGREWAAVRVVRDPAGATWELQIRPAGEQ